MTTSLKPIETRYKGYRFRSRLEARWAVFFDSLGLPYSYELEGFDLEGVWYLPDFMLPRGFEACPCEDSDPDYFSPVWVEIKPASQIQDESATEKARRLAIASGRPVYIFAGEPYIGAYSATMWHVDGERVTWCEPWIWSECPACGGIDLQHRAGVRGDSVEDDGLCYPMFQCMHCDVHDRSVIVDTHDRYWHKGLWVVLKRGWTPMRGQKLMRAFADARGARFEYGEHGGR